MTRPADGALLVLDNVSGGYRKDLEILHKISISVRPAEVVSIIGPNGAGKSTILKAAYGLVTLNAGQVVFDGSDITEAAASARLSRGMAFSPQGRSIFTEMTVEENLNLGAYIFRRRRLVREALNHAYSAFPQLYDKRGSIAGRLSGGQMQLLEIARALLVQPKLLILDEPSLGLSPKLSEEVFDNLSHLRSTGLAMLIVEQNAEESLAISDYAFAIEQGANVVCGSADSMRSDPMVRSSYLGI